MRAALSLPGLMLLILNAAPPGEDVIRQMHQRYLGAWASTFTFEQKTTLADGQVETWYEAAELPGRLRIDIAPASAGRAILFRGDSIYNYRGGRRGRGGPFIHPLLVLLYDVHHQSPDTTIARLRALGFDLTKSHTRQWEGKPVIVVGAAAGDSLSAQFWIETERLLPVRVLQPNANGLLDDRIGNYEVLAKGWGERRVETWQNGSRIQLEEYSHVRANVTHEAGLFEPALDYKLPNWIAQQKSP